MNKYILVPHEKYQHLQRRAQQKYIQQVDTHRVEPKDGERVDIKDMPQVDYAQDEPSELSVDHIVDIMPKNARNRARALLCILQKYVQWTDTGELVYDGAPIEGSHIVDLIRYTVIKHYTKKPPLGSHEYFAILSKINVPRSLIVNEIEKPSVLPWHALPS